MTNCVLVDDHLLLLELLADAVRTVPGVSVVATATDVSDADRIAALDCVDLLIVDRKLPAGDGMDFVRTVLARHPGLRCIVIAGATTDFVCPPDLLDCVVAVIDKAHASEMLLTEVRKFAAGSTAAAAGPPPLHGIEARLTPREFELFVILGEGLSNKELGQRCGISTRTVETHRKAISRKLGQSGAALIRLATLFRHSRHGFDVHASPLAPPHLTDSTE